MAEAARVYARKANLGTAAENHRVRIRALALKKMAFLRVRAVQPEARVRERVFGLLWNSGKPLFRHRNIEESTAAPFFMAVGFVLVWILGRREIWSLPLLLVIPFPFDWMAGSGGMRPCPRAGGVQWRQPAGPAHASTTWSWYRPRRSVIRLTASILKRRLAERCQVLVFFRCRQQYATMILPP